MGTLPPLQKGSSDRVIMVPGDGVEIHDWWNMSFTTTIKSCELGRQQKSTN